MWKFLGDHYEGFDIGKINIGDFWTIDENIWRIVDIKDDEITVMPDNVINVSGTYDQINDIFFGYVRNYVKHNVFKSNDVKYVDLPTYDDLFDIDHKFDIFKTKKWDVTFIVADHSYWLKHNNNFIFVDVNGCPRARMETNKICAVKPKIILECNKKDESIIKELENVIAKLMDICDKLKEEENKND